MSKLYVLCECDENSTTDHSQESVTYGHLAEMTHAEHLHRYGWCMCDDNEGAKVYDDCPSREWQPCLVCGESYPPNGLVTCDDCEVGSETN